MFNLLPILSRSSIFQFSCWTELHPPGFSINPVTRFLSILMESVSSTGPRWYNSNQKNWCLPPTAHKPRQAAAHDCGDHRQRQGARPDRAHLLAIYKWGTGTQAEVMLFLYYLLTSKFLLCSLFFCVVKWISVSVFGYINLSTFTFLSVSPQAAHVHL